MGHFVTLGDVLYIRLTGTVFLALITMPLNPHNDSVSCILVRVRLVMRVMRPLQGSILMEMDR